MARQKPPQAEVKVDLSKADTIQCDDCGNYLFITAHVIKRLSPIISPTGQEALIPVQVYSCGNCGKVPKMFLQGSGLGDEINKPKEDALSRPDLME
jgi:DNA-directed RNA polymerase subunit RPC12/RpoP